MAPTFEGNADKAALNVSKHGVSFEEARTVFGDPLEKTRPDQLHSGSGEERWVTVGRSRDGRILVVVHSEQEGGIRISARGGRRGPSASSMKKKANREPDDPDVRAEYDFKLAPRGTYASRFREAPVDGGTTIGGVRSWAPLIDFPWRGSEKRITADTCSTWVRAEGAYTGYSGPDFKSFLSKEEQGACRGAEHWLRIDQPVHSSLSSPAAINSFLIAMWVVAPTRTSVSLRFEVTRSKPTVTRVLDRFQWIEGQALDRIHARHLEETARLLPPVRDLYAGNRRLRNALVLTGQGCMSKQWQVAFICFAAAEAILTHSIDRGLSRRLSENFASLTEIDEAGRQRAQERFSRLYGIRSDIVHGRAHGRRVSEVNLKDLAEFSDLLRILWRRVLESSDVRAALEGDDEQRELFFKKRCEPGSIEQ